MTGGSRTALPRQQTLRALVDWSHSLLSEPERILLRRLSVFAGGWTLETAERVCVGAGIESGEVLDLLTPLVQKSLVMFDEQAAEPRRLRFGDLPKYRMLETIRQYAREKLLESCESAQIYAQHLDGFLQMAEAATLQLSGPDQARG